MDKKELIKKALTDGDGILRLAPNWVPRAFCIPGKRLKLHPNDYYALGAHRGGIDERWLASTVKADNGPQTPKDEGLSYVFIENGTHGEKILFKEIIENTGDIILGKETMEKEGGWVMFAKFFDNMDPLPFHMHQNDELAAKIGSKGKPEAYYFPAQLNNHPGYFPLTYFGLEPGTTKDDVKKAFQEIRRVSAKGANFICSVPVPERNSLQSPIRGTLYSEKELEEIINQLHSKVALINKNYQRILKTLRAKGEVKVKGDSIDNLELSITIDLHRSAPVEIDKGGFSSGEKSTAIMALILSMMLTSPTPIYMFDEFDVYLDDKSLLDVMKLIKENLKDFQGIITTTHRDEILSSADLIYYLEFDDKEKATKILLIDVSALEKQ